MPWKELIDHRPHPSIAFTGGVFESSPADDRHLASLHCIIQVLQNTGCGRYAGTSSQAALTRLIGLAATTKPDGRCSVKIFTDAASTCAACPGGYKVVRAHACCAHQTLAAPNARLSRWKRCDSGRISQADYAAVLKWPTWALYARLKAARAVQRST